jgi:hypothetical protein
MFPWNYGFVLDKGHIIFLGVFYTVVLVVIGTLLVAALRTLRDMRRNRASSLVWHADFEELPRSERPCRHAFTGELPGRVCEFAFECGQCEKHHSLAMHDFPELLPGVIDDSLGIEIPLDRYYDRSHIWARPESDGSFTLGLDEIARRVAAHPETIELPEPGKRLAARSEAWKMRVNGTVIRVRAPFDCQVVETSESGKPWRLRVMALPGASFTHLLRGVEVSRWMMRELERLQVMVATAAAGPSLADGGIPVDDFARACPQADWSAITAAMFLEN